MVAVSASTAGCVDNSGAQSGAGHGSGRDRLIANEAQVHPRADTAVPCWANTNNAPQPIARKLRTLTTKGPGAIAAAAILVSRARQTSSLLASTSPPTDTSTAEPLRWVVARSALSTSNGRLQRGHRSCRMENLQNRAHGALLITQRLGVMAALQFEEQDHGLLFIADKDPAGSGSLPDPRDFCQMPCGRSYNA